MKHNGRIIIFSAFFLLFWSFITYKLYTLQIRDNTNFKALAAGQQGYKSSIATTRGLISSADGVELAINVPSYTVYVYTPNIVNLNEFKAQVLPLFNFDIAQFNSITSSGVEYFQLAKNISPSQKDKLANEISSSDQQALQYILSEKRSYPNDTLLSQVLGYVDFSSGDGQYGLEGYFNGDLKGIDGTILGDKDQFGNPIVNSNFEIQPPVPGEDITLTINALLQKVVEEKLKNWVDSQQADSGTVIIMDPRTGAILAMADYPTYDPNKYYEGFELDCNNYMFQHEDACKQPDTKLDASLLQQSFTNEAVSLLYEPGSVMKAITAAAALQEGKITPDTTVDDKTGYYSASGEKVYNYNKEPDGTMNMAEILKKSSNVGASLVANMLGVDAMDKYYKAFGVGSLTNITLEGEETAQLPDTSKWLPIDLATASFGQYIAATPLQVIDIYQAIANSGIRMKPYIVQSVTKNGQVIQTKPESEGRVISTKTAGQLTQMLQYATTGEPAYGLRSIKQYMPMIASKTGSAQVPNLNGPGYQNGLINATYVGYAPANSPQFVMLVMLKDARAGPYAATTAVPLWADIAQNIFMYDKIAPQ